EPTLVGLADGDGEQCLLDAGRRGEALRYPQRGGVERVGAARRLGRGRMLELGRVEAAVGGTLPVAGITGVGLPVVRGVDLRYSRFARHEISFWLAGRMTLPGRQCHT